MIKKTFLILATLLCMPAVASTAPAPQRFSTLALTAGGILKVAPFEGACLPGANIITADWCYHPHHWWGVGAKMSYWFSPFLLGYKDRNDVGLHEIPVTAYLRGIAGSGGNVQAYASVGGGFVAVLGMMGLGVVGAMEAEVGLNATISERTKFTTAARYLAYGHPSVGICPIGTADFRVGVSFEI